MRPPHSRRLSALVPVAALIAAAPACARVAGEGPYAVLDDDTSPGDDDTSSDDDTSPDDDATPPDDDTGGDDDTVPPDDDTTPPELFPDPDGSLYGPVSLFADLLPLFTDTASEKGCYCHMVDPAPADLVLATADDAWYDLVGVESPNFPGVVRVEPGDPDVSLLFAKLYQEPSLFYYDWQPMPPTGTRWGGEELNLVYNWILQGAPNN
ncbi:hypothetical protein L6R50_24415 [Myxococcota bacterium]|nr:hypothetical protein [Myxococcota bacterium]